jgi:diguanylate cyclase (GGDEF)-like protein/PAS domain S-box-containing protein
MRYRRLFETAKDGILILDAETGEVTDANPFIEELLGYPRSELLGKALWDLGPFKDIVASQAAFRRLQLQKYVRYEDLPLETKDGQRRQVEFVSNVYLAGEQTVIQCNVRDITARKQAEADVRKVNTELSGLVVELQRRDLQRQSLIRMTDLLQICTTQAEAYQVVGLMASEFYPGQGGSLAIQHGWDHSFETVARWGKTELMEPIFALEDCWAMRRGQTGLLCRHFVHPPPAGYLCVPLVVQGDTFGVLSFSNGVSAEAQPTSQQQLAITIGEAIKLALSNLRLKDELREQAVRDPLTGLFNRRYLEDSLMRELHRARRGSGLLCLVMLDLDQFKQFNDSFGHSAGDQMLRALAQLLQQHLRDSDILCRYGGEEFVLVLPDSSLADTLERVEQVRVLVKDLRVGPGEQMLQPVTLSAGVAGAYEHGFDARELLRAADNAMYAAKRAGRDRIVVDQGPESRA